MLDNERREIRFLKTIFVYTKLINNQKSRLYFDY